jgi:hypothetical protein
MAITKIHFANSGGRSLKLSFRGDLTGYLDDVMIDAAMHEGVRPNCRRWLRTFSSSMR